MANDVKQVKVDNWGIYFLQRLKHFFNRTDYCDLTLQFQDNAQLKVHRLVLSACTEYFELLERTCEMYEDCLVMPDDLQADIVVPIVNFMYTGQLEFRMELLEKLHQCSEIMNMPVLTKLLDSHRPKLKFANSYKRPAKRVQYAKETIKKISPTEIVTTTPVTYKRSHSKAFEQTTVYRDKKIYMPVNKPAMVNNGGRLYREPSPIPLDQSYNKKVVLGDPRPTRYELPEELDTDNVFENSFCNISYASQPLMVHPDTRKQYAKRPRLATEPSTSKKLGPATVDIVECKKPAKVHEEALFEDSIADESEIFSESFVKAECSRDSNQLFDQILDRNDEPPKVTVETKSVKSSNLDHAKIISEVLKKYPHLVKSNKNIKLKILNTQTTKKEKKQKLSPTPVLHKPIKIEKEVDYTFETDVLDSKQAAKLIAMGAENIEGPWICLICGTPGKAMNFTSYYKFRRHLVEVHHEKPVVTICEHCGQRSTKRNYILHHMYTKHGVEPPPPYHFPKCNQCNYIALTEVLLVKHKSSTHSEIKNFRCNVCPAAFNTSTALLMHIQNTGHKYSDKKSNLQCIYCLKVFMRESNLYAHLKTHHKINAMKDGIIDDSDDEDKQDQKSIVKSEPTANDFEEMDIQYQIQQRADGNITVVTKKAPEPINMKQKILNTSLPTQTNTHKNNLPKSSLDVQNEFIHEIESTSNDPHEEIVMIGNNEYIMRDNQLIPRRSKQVSEEYVLSDHGLQPVPTTPMEFTQENIQHASMLLKNPDNITQPIPIYVSNEEEYKALMASNQPIIFDNVDSNKTLTVLTTPHTSTLETTAVDMNTNQSNDMMIIQDEYPLNVSEAVASENSNIVVVYSHQVGNENKQYQLLTTQGLEAQFVQSSAILTQNYDTITTTAPGMNTHVLEKQVAEVWQNNLHQIVDTNQIEITPVTSLHSIVEETNQVQTQTLISVSESNNEIVELPQVQLTSNTIEISNDSMSVAAVNQCQDMVVEVVAPNENIVENTGEGCAGDIQNTYDMEVDEELVEHDEGHLEHPVDETVEPTDTIIENEAEPGEEIISNSDTVVEETEFIESQTYTQPDSNIAPSDSIDEVQLQSEEMSIDCQTGEIIESNDEESASDNITAEDSIAVEHGLDEDVSEKVQTLTSEWAEEETHDRTDKETNMIQSENILDRQDDRRNLIQAEVMKDGQDDDTNIIHAEDTQEREGEQILEGQAENTPDKPEADILDDNRIETAHHDDSDTLNNDQHKDTETSEVEESIENIQQEVEKEMVSSTLSVEQENVGDVNDDLNSSLDESGHDQEMPVPTSIVLIDPSVAQEKISSLLNDWEDNDSQEDNNSNAENAPVESDVIVQSSPNENSEKSTSEKGNTEQQDKIKSLVSDWDEDEEENKD